MASKNYFVDGIGEVRVCKRRGSKKISLRVINAYVKVTQPIWVPYNSGVSFAVSHKSWIDKQKTVQQQALPGPNLQIGKQHTLRYQSAPALKSRVTTSEVVISVPPHLHMHSPQVLEITRKASRRALKNEAQILLRQRLDAIANQYGLSYHDVRFKNMRTRWGSCNNNRIIALNISLLLLPYELIDYVLLHELMHTEHLNHSKDFWDDIAKIMPDYKQRRKELKNAQNSILLLH